MFTLEPGYDKKLSNQVKPKKSIDWTSILFLNLAAGMVPSSSEVI